HYNGDIVRLTRKPHCGDRRRVEAGSRGRRLARIQWMGTAFDRICFGLRRASRTVLGFGRSNTQEMIQDQLVTVNARKYDMKVRKSWQCRLVERSDSLVKLIGEFDSDVSHAGLGSIARGTVSEEYYWLDRWYNVFSFSEPDGSFRNLYCNITMPPKFEKGILDYVDLDIDVIVWPDGRVETLDEDDFAENSELFGYSAEVRQNALDSLSELRSAIAAGAYPFSAN